MQKRTMYIDTDTGEIVSDQRRTVGNRFDAEKGYLFRNQAGKFSQFYDVPFPQEINDIELGRMTRLARHMWSKTNMLGYRGNGGIRPYDMAGIANLINLGERQTYRFVTKMVELGIMAIVKIDSGGKIDCQYYINPLYFSSSNRISLNLYLLFRESLDAYIPKWAQERFNEQVKSVR